MAVLAVGVRGIGCRVMAVLAKNVVWRESGQEDRQQHEPSAARKPAFPGDRHLSSLPLESTSAEYGSLTTRVEPALTVNPR